MASLNVEAVITMRFENRKCISAMLEAAQLAEELFDQYPYNDDAKKLAKKLRYVAKHTKVQVGVGGTPLIKKS